MPNWVYNNVGVSGTYEDLLAFRTRAWTPHFEAVYENHSATDELALSGEEFSFWNYIAPPESAVLSGEYFGTHGWSEGKATGDTENNWYNFNNREWGTKWDAGSVEEDELSEGDTWFGFKFDTAWGVPEPVLRAMVEAHPTLKFDFHCEEEQGWGVEYEGIDGELIVTDHWDIPETHADYTKRGNECRCEWGEDEEYWFEDCPRPEHKVVSLDPKPQTEHDLFTKFEEEFAKPSAE